MVEECTGESLFQLSDTNIKTLVMLCGYFSIVTYFNTLLNFNTNEVYSTTGF